MTDKCDKWDFENKPAEPYREIASLRAEVEQLLAAFTELQTVAQKVVDETDRIHDNDPWPIKYRAPYGEIVELRQLLAKQYGMRGK